MVETTLLSHCHYESKHAQILKVNELDTKYICCPFDYVLFITLLQEGRFQYQLIPQLYQRHYPNRVLPHAVRYVL